MEILATGRGGNLLHHFFVDFTFAAQAEHVQFDVRFLCPADQLLWRMPASGGFVLAIGQDDDELVALRPAAARASMPA